MRIQDLSLNNQLIIEEPQKGSTQNGDLLNEPDYPIESAFTQLMNNHIAVIEPECRERVKECKKEITELSMMAFKDTFCSHWLILKFGLGDEDVLRTIFLQLSETFESIKRKSGELKGRLKLKQNSERMLSIECLIKELGQKVQKKEGGGLQAFAISALSNLFLGTGKPDEPYSSLMEGCRVLREQVVGLVKELNIHLRDLQETSLQREMVRKIAAIEAIFLKQIEANEDLKGDNASLLICKKKVQSSLQKLTELVNYSDDLVKDKNVSLSLDSEQLLEITAIHDLLMKTLTALIGELTVHGPGNNIEEETIKAYGENYVPEEVCCLDLFLGGGIIDCDHETVAAWKNRVSDYKQRLDKHSLAPRLVLVEAKLRFYEYFIEMSALSKESVHRLFIQKVVPLLLKDLRRYLDEINLKKVNDHCSEDNYVECSVLIKKASRINGQIINLVLRLFELENRSHLQGFKQIPLKTLLAYYDLSYRAFSSANQLLHRLTIIKKEINPAERLSWSSDTYDRVGAEFLLHLVCGRKRNKEVKRQKGQDLIDERQLNGASGGTEYLFSNELMTVNDKAKLLIKKELFSLSETKELQHLSGSNLIYTLTGGIPPKSFRDDLRGRFKALNIILSRICYLRSIIGNSESLKEKLGRDDRLNQYKKVTMLKQSYWQIMHLQKECFKEMLTSDSSAKDLTMENRHEQCNVIKGYIEQLRFNLLISDWKKQIFVDMATIYADSRQMIDKKVRERCKPEKYSLRHLNQFSWGELVVNNPIDGDFAYFWRELKVLLGIDFVSQIIAMEDQIDLLKKQQNKMDCDQLKALQICQYQFVLTKIIDLISEKQRYLRKDIDPHSAMGVVLKADLTTLNDAYDYYIRQHGSLNPPTEEWWNALLKSPFVSFGEVFEIKMLWGYLLWKYVPTDELEIRKQYADLGYCMMEDVKLLLPTIEVDNIGRTMRQVHTTLQEFLNWADEHPQAAATLISDIALLIMTFGDQVLIDRFLSLMRARAYANAFFTHLGNAYEEPIEKLDELKFKALADLFRYLPAASSLIASLAKNMTTLGAQIVNGNPLSGALGCLIGSVKDVSQVMLLQKISDIASAEALFVSEMIAIARGDDFAQILETRRLLAMTEFGANLRYAFSNPKGFQMAVRKEATMWWKVLTHTEDYLELSARIVVQIICPLVSLKVAHSFFVAVISASLGIWVAIPVFIAITVIGISLSSHAYSLLNRYTGTRTKIEKLEMLSSSGRQQFKHYCKEQTKEEIKRQAAKLIKESKQFNTVTSVPSYRDPLPSKVNELIDQCVIEMKKELEQKGKDKHLDPKDFVVLFAEIVTVAHLSKKFEQKICENISESHTKNKIVKIAHRTYAKIIDRLEFEWLQGEIEESLFNKVFNEIIKKPEITEKNIRRLFRDSFNDEERKVLDGESLKDTVPFYFKEKLKKKKPLVDDREIDGVFDGWLKSNPASA